MQIKFMKNYKINMLEVNLFNSKMMNKLKCTLIIFKFKITLKVNIFKLLWTLIKLIFYGLALIIII